MEIARDGITLAETAMILCNEMLDGQYSAEKLDTLHFLAAKGRKECLAMIEDFRIVRRGWMLVYPLT